MQLENRMQQTRPKQLSFEQSIQQSELIAIDSTIEIVEYLTDASIWYSNDLEVNCGIVKETSSEKRYHYHHKQQQKYSIAQLHKSK
jgi:hypothetical protein